MTTWDDLYKSVGYLISVFFSYTWVEFFSVLPLLALLLGLGFINLLLGSWGDQLVEGLDTNIRRLLSFLTGGKKHVGADAKTTEYSMVGCLDPSFAIPPDTYRAYRAYRADSYRSSIFDPPTSPEEKDTKFPAAHAISKGNAVVMAMCMKLAYEDWPIVRDIVDNLWNRHGEPRLSFTAGFTFDYASPVGDRSATSKIHLDSDAMVLAVNAINATGSIDTSKPEAVILAFRGTEPLELADLQSDFRTVPELGKWGRVHLGFLGALGLDKDLEYATGGCALTYTYLDSHHKDEQTIESKAALTPYEVLRNRVLNSMIGNTSKLYITGHSLGGAVAVAFTAAFLVDSEVDPALKLRIGALYTFGQPRVGNYEFLRHMRQYLMAPDEESNANGQSVSGKDHSKQTVNFDDTSRLRDQSRDQSSNNDDESDPPSAFEGVNRKAHVKQKDPEKPKAPVLYSSKYVRVVNTSDIVPLIPPTWQEVYQHGGELVYLTFKEGPGVLKLAKTPGGVVFLTEEPQLHLKAAVLSNIRKLMFFARVWSGIGRPAGWQGEENWVRLLMRVAAVVLAPFVAGVNDHMPGDYFQAVLNSDPSDWRVTEHTPQQISADLTPPPIKFVNSLVDAKNSALESAGHTATALSGTMSNAARTFTRTVGSFRQVPHEHSR